MVESKKQQIFKKPCPIGFLVEALKKLMDRRLTMKFKDTYPRRHPLMNDP